MSTLNELAAVIALLRTGDDAFTALVGDRVFPVELPGRARFSNAQPGIVVQPVPGGVNNEVPMAHFPFRVRAFGGDETFTSAFAVYQALRAKLRAARNATTAHGKILRVNEDAFAIPLTNRDLKWPEHVSTWTAFIRAI